MLKKIKDPGSAITHFIAAVLSALAAIPLLLKAANLATFTHTLALATFITSMILLYLASTVYHTFDVSPEINQLLKKIDHIMIYILIAGTYTPVCIIVLSDNGGRLLFGLIWGIALVGIFITAAWIHCPKWFSSLVYISMGWICVLAFKNLIAALPQSAFIWLLTGGIIYTIGGVIYALKLPLFNSRHRNFGSHEIFHLFVMGGSCCHYITMYLVT